MPGVSPEPGSTVSGVNPSQLQPRLRRALNSSARALPASASGPSLLIPCDSKMLMASLSAVIILLSQNNLAPSRYITVKMYLAGLGKARPLRYWGRPGKAAVVKAKLLHSFLVHPKTKMCSVPFVADWNIHEPFQKAQGIILCHLILQVFSYLSFALSSQNLHIFPNWNWFLAYNVVG